MKSWLLILIILGVIIFLAIIGLFLISLIGYQNIKNTSTLNETDNSSIEGVYQSNLTEQCLGVNVEIIPNGNTFIVRRGPGGGFNEDESVIANVFINGRLLSPFEYTIQNLDPNFKLWDPLVSANITIPGYSSGEVEVVLRMANGNCPVVRAL